MFNTNQFNNSKYIIESVGCKIGGMYRSSYILLKETREVSMIFDRFRSRETQKVYEMLMKTFNDVRFHTISSFTGATDINIEIHLTRNDLCKHSSTLKDAYDKLRNIYSFENATFDFSVEAEYDYLGCMYPNDNRFIIPKRISSNWVTLNISMMKIYPDILDYFKM